MDGYLNLLSALGREQYRDPELAMTLMRMSERARSMGNRLGISGGCSKATHPTP